MAAPHPTTARMPHLRRRPASRTHPLALLGGAGTAVLVLFLLLALAVSRHPAPFAADAALLNGFVGVRTAALTVLARILAVATDPAATAAAAIIVALWLVLRSRDRRSAVFLMAVAVTTAALLEFAKLVVDRPRPPTALQLMPETNNSFPSGHVTGVVAVFGTLALIAVLRGARRSVVVPCWVALVVLVVLDRLYLGVHWASDVLGAVLLGSTILLAATVIARQVLPGAPAAEPLSGNGSARWR